jgi:hypothetical protein
MILFTNDNGEIKDVGKTSDPSLIEVEVNDVDNPFNGWSTAKICCYRVNVVDGRVVMITPYVDSRLIEHIDMLGKEVDAITPYTETKTAYIGDTEAVFYPPSIGNATVYFDKPYTMEKLSDRIIISFDELEEVTEITISII